MSAIQITYNKTITIPYFFKNLPKEVQDLAFECNVDHRYQMKIVLNQLVDYIHCINCDRLIDPSLLNKVNCCSSECMYDCQSGYDSY